jgi:hypothetical protein
MSFPRIWNKVQILGKIGSVYLQMVFIEQRDYIDSMNLENFSRKKYNALGLLYTTPLTF